MLLLLYLGCISNERSIPFCYLLHLLVQTHRVLLLCFLESSLLKKLEWETRGPGILLEAFFKLVAEICLFH